MPPLATKFCSAAIGREGSLSDIMLGQSKSLPSRWPEIARIAWAMMVRGVVQGTEITAGSDLADRKQKASKNWRGHDDVMQIRSFRGSGEPARSSYYQCARWIGTRSAQSIRASRPSAASTGRTRDRTRPMPFVTRFDHEAIRPNVAPTLSEEFAGGGSQPKTERPPEECERSSSSAMRFATAGPFRAVKLSGLLVQPQQRPQFFITAEVPPATSSHRKYRLPCFENPAKPLLAACRMLLGNKANPGRQVAAGREGFPIGWSGASIRSPDGMRRFSLRLHAGGVRGTKARRPAEKS